MKARMTFWYFFLVRYIHGAAATAWGLRDSDRKPSETTAVCFWAKPLISEFFRTAEKMGGKTSDYQKSE
tara:strand:+ start:289 stop:495 length:207 start_codon:yes stop_codon:yes gene_type:complete